MKPITCVNPRCGAVLDHHRSQGTHPDPGGVMADVGMATLCLDCSTVIVVDRGGDARHPTDAERAVIEASEGYRNAVGFVTMVNSVKRARWASMN